MELCLGLDDEPARSLGARIRGQLNMGDILVSICYRPPDQAEIDEVFFKQLEESSCLQALVLMGDLDHSDTCCRYCRAGFGNVWMMTS